MSGRFFRQAGSDSEDSSSEEEEMMSDSDEEQTTKKQKKPKGSDDSSDDSDEDDSDEDDSDDDDDAAAPGATATRKPMSRFMLGAADDDSDEDEVKKVIKSAKDKRSDEFESVVKSIENAQRIDDWVAISKEYDGLLRLCDRQKNMNEVIPPSFIRIIAELEPFLNTSIAKEKDAKKKMKVPNAKAMNAMKQKLKKTIKENEEEVRKYRENPDSYEEDINAAAAAAAAPERSSGPSRRRTAAAEEGGEEDDDFQTVGRGGRALNLTSEGLFKSLAGILEARGKKSTDRNEQVTILAKLLEVAVSPYQKIRVLLALIAARFDYNPASTHMPTNLWSEARKETDQLLQILATEQGYVVREETEDYDDSIDRLPNENGEGPVVAVRGSVISFVDRLDDEFTKALQNIDPHTTEYVERLSDEKFLYQTIIRAQCYYEQTKQRDLHRIIMRRLEHIYPKQDIIIQALEAANAAAQPNLTSTLTPSAAEVAQEGGPTKLVRALCVQLYKAPGLDAERARTRAMLCHIYHHALHADYHTAREMFLMSHLQESIEMADAATQILFNRVVVQLGMSAFRLGLIKETQTALHDIFATGRVKELLAQGVQRQNQYSTVTPEQEKLDRQRQLPFHMHVNLELLECVYLIASMLLEVPNIAYAGNDPELRKKVISRPYRRMLDYTDRQVFSGPPENTRDHIMQATKSLQNGDWKQCTEMIDSIKIWKLMPGWEEVRPILAKRVQEEGLRTYLFTYASYYNTVSLAHLAETFSLEVQEVRTIVSRMIWSEELAASLDPLAGPQGSGGVVVLHRLELSKVQQLAQTLAERANTMLEQNERALDGILGEGKDRSGPGGGGDRERGEGTRTRREGRGGSSRGRGRGRGRAQFQGSALGSISQHV